MLLQPNNTIIKIATSNKKRLNSRGIGRPAAFILIVLWAGFLGTLVVNRQNLIDWWKLHNYTPPASISQLASQDTMTDYGRKIFYVNQPQLHDKSTFSEACPNNGGEQTIVLGCYNSNQAGIFLLDVTEPRLNGVEEVTAAHEMLHAAYDRLSTDERNNVDMMLKDYYNNQLTDERIRSTIDAYKKSEPNDLVNEMHSIFGTEIVNLPPGLEKHYSKYFSNRKQVAEYANRYQAEFSSRHTAVDRDDATLANLKTQIEANEAQLKTKQNSIDNEQSRLVALRKSGAVDQYNAGVPAYNALIDSYNNQVETVKNLTDQYNQLVARRNAVAFEEDKLIDALSTNVTPIQK